MHEHSAVPAAVPRTDAPAGSDQDDDAPPAHAHSMLWMVACCAPMILIALAIALGVFGPR
jgi:hypothetical protein